MKTMFNQLRLNHRYWTILSVIFIFSLIQLVENQWLFYLNNLITYFLISLPFVIGQRLIESREAKKLQTKLLTLLTYGAFPAIVVLNDISNESSSFTNSVFIFVLLVTQLSLFAHQAFKKLKGTETISFLSQINLDKWLLMVLAAISLYVGLLIASDLPLWMSSNSVDDINLSEVLKQPWLVVSMSVQIFLLFLIGFFFYWLNKNILVTNVLRKRGLVTYLIIMAGTVCALYPVLIQFHLWLPINYMASPIIPSVEADPFSWQNGRVFFAVMLISLPFILVGEWNKNLQKMALVTKEHTQTELQLLKQQIDPHFFLNTLNNLYALTRKKSDIAPEVVIQLSEVMRYVVYRGQESYVPLSEELTYMEDYLALQRLRYRDDVEINFDIEVDDQSVNIAPLLFIILVENAFKHGIEKSLQQRFVHIQLQLADNTLTFICKNSLEASSAKEEPEFGVGLNNLSRRLQLLYPKQHTLEFESKTQEFMASLTIQLNDGKNR